MTDQKPQERADYVQLKAKAGGDDLIALYGPGRQVFQRIMQVLSGLQDVGNVSIGIDKAIQFGGFIIDATKAPFRVNGRQWSIGYNLAAPGALSNSVSLQNRPSGQPKDGLALVTVEEIRYQGPSVAMVEVQFLAVSGEISTDAPRDIEAPIGADASSGAAHFKNGVPQVGSLSTTAAYAAAASRPAYLGNVAVGSPSEVWRPDGLVLWPGEILSVVQATPLVAMTLTLVGKVWLFTKGIA